MKKTNYLLAAISLLAIASMTSCSKDEVKDACTGCHLESTIYEMHIEENGDTTQHAETEIWDITNSAGGDEFCGDELLNAEGPEFYFTVTDTLIGDLHGEPLPPGDYGPGVDNNYVVHCEEHAGEDDDHDDHK
tara:strand:+ start:188 stop:586 length:399 start_codon:yes stop_codon:yes gene_type:complete